MIAVMIAVNIVAADPAELARQYRAFRDNYVVTRTKALNDEQRSLRGVRTKEAAERKKRIGDDLRLLKQRPRDVVPTMPSVLSVGVYGVFDPGDLVIRQILGPTEMVVKYDEDLAIVRGMDTTRRAIDRGIVEPIVFGVTSEEERNNLLGLQRTVFILEPVDISKVKAMDADEQKQARK